MWRRWRRPSMARIRGAWAKRGSSGRSDAVPCDKMVCAKMRQDGVRDTRLLADKSPLPSGGGRPSRRGGVGTVSSAVQEPCAGVHRHSSARLPSAAASGLRFPRRPMARVVSKTSGREIVSQRRSAVSM